MTPFETLGLPASPEVSDDDARSAWRRIAAATHPDRPDGGNPGAYAAAAAAYDALRTAAGRGEVLAGLAEAAPGLRPARPVLRPARPLRLLARLLAAGAAGALAVTATGWSAASLAIIAGALTWLFVTGRNDMAVRRRELGPGRAM